jgi:hypothetical protein
MPKLSDYINNRNAVWVSICFAGFILSRMAVAKYGVSAAGPLFIITLVVAYTYARIIFILNQKKEFDDWIKSVEEHIKKDHGSK